MQNEKAKALTDSITDSIKALAAMTDETAQSEAYKAYLLTMGRFHNYSFGNTLLIYRQRPTATRVAGFHAWKDLGRSVKKGAKGIAILAPCISKRKTTDTATGEESTSKYLYGFRVAHVFDRADTEGRELPTLNYNATEGGEDILPRLEHAAEALGITLEYSDDIEADGYSKGGKIVIASRLCTAAKCGTIAHELAHEILHFRNQRGATLSREQRELEAESTSFAVLAQLGIEQPSSVYLAGWKADAEKITAALNTIRCAVHEILAAVEGDEAEQTTEDEAAAIAA